MIRAGEEARDDESHERANGLLQSFNSRNDPQPARVI
jgi:hypothetical protein